MPADSRSPDAPSGETSRLCGSQGVDEDGLCVRCGLVAPDPSEDSATECPPGFLVSSSAPSGERCEGCDEPATREDVEGIQLCDACYEAAPLADNPAPSGETYTPKAIQCPGCSAWIHESDGHFCALSHSAPSGAGMPDWVQNVIDLARNEVKHENDDSITATVAWLADAFARLTRERDEARSKVILAVNTEREWCAVLVEHYWNRAGQSAASVIRARYDSSPPGATT